MRGSRFLSLTMTVAIYALLQARFWPWRTRLSNIMDAWATSWDMLRPAEKWVEGNKMHQADIKRKCWALFTLQLALRDARVTT